MAYRECFAAKEHFLRCISTGPASQFNAKRWKCFAVGRGDLEECESAFEMAVSFSGRSGRNYSAEKNTAQSAEHHKQNLIYSFLHNNQ